MGGEQEETGWKYLHGDVFRFPPHINLISAMLGVGVQVRPNHLFPARGFGRARSNGSLCGIWGCLMDPSAGGGPVVGRWWAGIPACMACAASLCTQACLTPRWMWGCSCDGTAALWCRARGCSWSKHFIRHLTPSSCHQHLDLGLHACTALPASGPGGQAWIGIALVPPRPHALNSGP